MLKKHPMNEDDRFLIEIKEKVTAKTVPRFPVVVQLLLLFIILGSLFAGLIIPKTMALFGGEDLTTVDQTAILTESTTSATALQKIDTVPIRARAAYVWDIKEQRVLYQKNADEVLPLASITKLMTALLAYELVEDNALVTIDELAAGQESGGNFRIGEVFNIRDLADFALVSSYNSAAYAIANSVGGLLGEEDSIAQFVTAMNLRAEELKLNDTKFSNSTGLDISTNKAGAYGTARDVSFLMEYILTKHPTILYPTVIDSTRLYNQSGEHHDARNTNNMVKDIPNLIGSKTGYTDLAGGNLTVALNIGFDRPVIITVLGSTMSERFSDVDKLIEAVQAVAVNRE